VWQLMQSPATARYRPRSTIAPSGAAAAIVGSKKQNSAAGAIDRSKRAMRGHPASALRTIRSEHSRNRSGPQRWRAHGRCRNYRIRCRRHGRRRRRRTTVPVQSISPCNALHGAHCGRHRSCRRNSRKIKLPLLSCCTPRGRPQNILQPRAEGCATAWFDVKAFRSFSLPRGP
jgi:hypothetical protein